MEALSASAAPRLRVAIAAVRATVGAGEMVDVPRNPASGEGPSDEKRDAAPSREGDVSGEGPAWVVVSHEALFEETAASRCDACGETIVEGEAGGEPFGFPGAGAYLWARGEETRIERVPLCASCASAIGMTALARWEIEEEEG
jgi:hypothetical protein